MQRTVESVSKNREAITCNGRPAFFASIYEDIRQCAMGWGWAVALHGSLMNDMDIMAMPWKDEAIKFEELIDKISRLFDENSLAENYTITYDEKPHNRVVGTIPIWEDFYLDISTIDTRKPMERIVERMKKKIQASDTKFDNITEMNAYDDGVDDAIEIVKEEGGIE